MRRRMSRKEKGGCVMGKGRRVRGERVRVGGRKAIWERGEVNWDRH